MNPEENQDPRTLDSVPASKVQRATRMLATGAKVGVNYVKHYARKLVDPELDRSELDQANAEDIYKTLSELKGSALKVAQMMSMDKGMLPKAYAQKFQMAQYSAPPLSGPLVIKTFRDTLGKSPLEIYDTFELKASHAASIGQVHRATLNGKTLAVKIQYPGVAESVRSDLRLVRPLAARVMGVRERDLARYFEEVEARLLEETDYGLELRRAQHISAACAHIPNLRFPAYYPELSSSRVLTMEWLEGVHLPEFMASNPPDAVRNQIGQALWDFTTYQMHELGQVHADPHPGNFLMTADGCLGVLDFGCVKEIPPDFYQHYFSVIRPEVRGNADRLLQTAMALELLDSADTLEHKDLVLGILTRFLELAQAPFFSDSFDFGNDDYLNSLYALGMDVAQMEQVKKIQGARGSQHALYINRTFFGLFSLLNTLKATLRSRDPWIAAMDIP